MVFPALHGGVAAGVVGVDVTGVVLVEVPGAEGDEPPHAPARQATASTGATNLNGSTPIVCGVAGDRPYQKTSKLPQRQQRPRRQETGDEGAWDVSGAKC